MKGLLVTRDHSHTLQAPSKKVAKRFKTFGKRCLFGSTSAQALRQRLEQFGHGDATVTEEADDVVVVSVPSLEARVAFRVNKTDVSAPTAPARALLRDILLRDLVSL